MPDNERSLPGLGPKGGQRRRQLLRAGLGLAGTALALDVMAAAKPAALALEAVTKVRTSGTRDTTDSPIGVNEGTQLTARRQSFHPTETQVQTAARIDGTLAQQDNRALEIGGFSPQDALHWLEQHWQEVLLVGIPVGTGATIAKIVHGRLTASKAMESSFQRALMLSESPDVESKADAAIELLYLLSDHRSEKYHQRIFAMAVDHFRQRKVENVVQRETIADFKYVPVLVFAALAIRERLQNKGESLGAAYKEFLNASHIHLDGLSLKDADLSYLVMDHATFTGAVLNSANFSHADLAGADLSHTTLNGTDLSHAILSDTKLTRARARGVNLSHALLRHADLGNTDLSYANLEEAQLGDDANLQGTKIYRATGLTSEMRKKYLEMGAIEQD